MDCMMVHDPGLFSIMNFSLIFSAGNLWFMKQWYLFYALDEEISVLLKGLNQAAHQEETKLKQVVSEIHKQNRNQPG